MYPRLFGGLDAQAEDLQFAGEAKKLVGYLQHPRIDTVQGALMTMVELMNAQQLSSKDLIEAGLLEAILPIVSCPCEVTSLAMEVLASCYQYLEDDPIIDEKLMKPLSTKMVELIRSYPDPSWNEVPSVFFAIAAMVKMAKWPDLGIYFLSADCIPALVAILNRTHTVLTEASVLALFKLYTTGDAEKNMNKLAAGDGFVQLCRVLSASEDLHLPGTRDMVTGMLLDLSQVPGVPRSLADHNMVKHLVQVLRNAECEEVQMSAVLVLARIANQDRACQLDAVREGAAEPLVRLMGGGSTELQSHAARLLAILTQAPPTHQQVLERSEAVPVLLRCLAAATPSVVEHAASVVACMAQNPNTHFQLVNWGVVPQVVPLLSSGTQKTKVYVLCSLYLFAQHDTRHAAVVSRAGAVPPLVSLLRLGGESGSVRPWAAAVLSLLARHPDMQVEIVSSGAVPPLIRLLEDGVTGNTSAAVVCSAAETLAALALTDSKRRHMMVRAGALSVCTGLMRSVDPTLQLWGAHVLRVLCEDADLCAELTAQEELLDVACKLLALPVPPEHSSPLTPSGSTRRADLLKAKAHTAWLIVRAAPLEGVCAALVRRGVVRSLVCLLQGGSPRPHSGWGGGLVVEGLEGHHGAAATAALLSLAANSTEARAAVREELVFQVWCGKSVTLEGLANTHQAR